MVSIWRSEAGCQAVLARYRAFLAHWPVPSLQRAVPTCAGETFVVSCGPQDAPPLLVFHGSGANAAMWMMEAADWSADFRVHVVDMLGEPGLSAPVRLPLETDAHALWLDDVLAALDVETAPVVGELLGGWLALDYAIRRPGRVSRMALLAPAGLGPQKNFLLKALPLLLLGAWGRRRMRQMVLGRPPAAPTPQMQAIGDFIGLIFANFRTRTDRLPVFADGSLRSLAMPVLTLMGGRDVLLDMRAARDRLSRLLPQDDSRYFPEDGHLLRAHIGLVSEFLRAGEEAQ